MAFSKTHKQACPLAATLNVLGDKWTMLVVREFYFGATRFNEIQRNTGIARNLLTDRLKRLVDDGILNRIEHTERGTQHIYELTDKGRSLEGVLVAMILWGNEQMYGEGKEPVLLFDKRNGKPVKHWQMLDVDGEVVPLGQFQPRPGPGANRYTRQRYSEAGLDNS